jgi:cysteine-rich repeat protein
MHEMPHRSSRPLIVVAVLLTLGPISMSILPRTARALTLDQRRCVLRLNADFERLASRFGKEFLLCIRDFGRDRLGGDPPSDCFQLDRDGRIARDRQKVDTDYQRWCVADPPPYGVTDPNTIEDAASEKEFALMSLLFGPVDVTLVTEEKDRFAAVCQQSVLRAVNRCQRRILREFKRCKQPGIVAGDITDAASLWSTCLGDDPKGRVFRACDPATGKIRTQIDNKCVARGVGLSEAFPVCATDDAATLAGCLEEALDCRSCLGLARADGLDPLVCDDFDDGLANLSCLAFCGDGDLDVGEQCDDGNTVSCDGCSVLCDLEPGFSCGDGTLSTACGEECDDGDTTPGDGCDDVCQIEFCGDGVIQVAQGEGCDDGNSDPCDGCSDTCQVEPGGICGDGIVFAVCEQCDDGNPFACDGCSDACQTETGFVCSDGTVNAACGEECDDSNTTSCDGCSGACKSETGFVCGDLTVNPACGEECEDGNAIDEDGCSAACQSEFCGDGVIQAGLVEACDDGNAVSCDGCSAVCAVEPGGVCGDGTLNATCEQCDDGNTDPCDGCSDACHTETGFVCGDSSINAACGEECDDGNPLDGDGCSSTCKIEVCGDGVIQATQGETCDDGNTISCDGCSSTCLVEPGGACGDGAVDATCGEQCDDGNTDPCDGCSDTCQTETAFVCGDGVVTNPVCEPCDDANPDLCDGCTPACEVETGIVCGDGTVNATCGEECDDGNTSDGDFCTSTCLNDPCDPFGLFSSSTTVVFDCGSPSYFVDFDVSSWEFVDGGGSLEITPQRYVEVDGAAQTLTGAPATCPGAFDVSTTHFGFCCTTLTLTGQYTTPDSWSGTFGWSFCDSPGCGCPLGTTGGCGTCTGTSGFVTTEGVRVP